jgi:hypothetical protein
MWTLKFICNDVEGILTSQSSLLRSQNLHYLYMQTFKRELCFELPPQCLIYYPFLYFSLMSLSPFL